MCHPRDSRCRRLFSTSVCAGGGRIRTSGRMRGAPSPPSQTAGPRRVPPTSCSASSRGWCARATARGCGGFVSNPCGCSAGRGQSRTRGTGKTLCSSLLSLARTRSSRAGGCSAPGSSRQSWVLMVTSSRNRPGGRIRSSRWHRRSACRSRGRTLVSSRETWWLDEKGVELEWVWRLLASEASWVAAAGWRTVPGVVVTVCRGSVLMLLLVGGKVRSCERLPREEGWL